MTNATSHSLIDYWIAINSNDLIYPIVLIIFYIIGFIVVWKFKVKNLLQDILEVYVYGTTFGWSAKNMREGVFDNPDDGKFIGGLILLIVTVVGIWKVFLSNQKDIVKPISIHSAMFGIDGNEQDVLPRIRSLINEGRLNIRVGVTLFGDPVPQTPKRLRLTYEHNGHVITQDYPEGLDVILP